MAYLAVLIMYKLIEFVQISLAFVCPVSGVESPSAVSISAFQPYREGCRNLLFYSGLLRRDGGASEERALARQTNDRQAATANELANTPESMLPA